MILSSGPFPFRKKPKSLESLSTFTIHPETFRIISYIGFWLMVVVGAILTFLYVPNEEISHSQLVKTFGYNNICILFDYPPSVYWTAQMLNYLQFTFFLYLFLIWLRNYKAYQQEIVSYSFFCFSSVSTIIEAILLSGFHMIFLINPSVNIIGHSLPFVGFEICLVLHAFQNFLFFKKAMILPSLVQNIGLFYLICFVLVAFLKIGLQIEALFHLKFFLFPILALRAVDLSWLVLGTIAPLFFSFFLRRRTAPITFHF